MRIKEAFLFLLFILLSPCVFGQLFINEFMADNASIIDDPDFDKKVDWVELHNSSSNQINLGNYYLSDDLNNPEKWAIPEGTIIEAGSYLLIWADDQDTGLHSNFKLSKDGEAIALYDPQGLILDSIIFSEQAKDVSFGRISDGDPAFSFFSTPTPGTSNVGISFAEIIYNKPIFSKKGGFYLENFDLQLYSTSGTIRYTIDGSMPTENAPIFNDPISIDETTVVRARVFSSGKLPGPTSTHSYFFNENFEDRQLPVVSIVTHPDHFWDEEFGLYTQDFLPIWEYPINIELFENDGNNRAVFNEPAGIRIKGNNSWRFPQKILGIYFKDDYGKKKLDYPIFAERERSNYDHFVLRASGNDQGSTFFRDGILQDLISENMDFPLQGFRATSLYINGEYFGLHNIRSKQNEEYFDHFFGLKKGDYDLILNDGEVDEGDDIAFNQLFDLFNQDLSVSANYNALETVMDMDNLIDFFVTQIWLSNRSWGHNIKMWKAKTPGSKWRFVLKDVDRGFYSFDNNDIDYFTETNISPSSYEYARVILRQLFQNQNFVDRFVGRFSDHLCTTFHPNHLQPLIDQYKNNIEAEIPYHLQVWGGQSTSYGDALPSQKYWEDEMLDLNSYAIERATFMYRDMTNHFDLSPKSTLGTICIPETAGQIQLNEIKIPAGKWAAPYFQDQPISLKAEATVGHEFMGWSAATYETFIPKYAVWKYSDDGATPNIGWNNINFNDNNWSSGPAQLGYGDGDEQTIVSFGSDPDNTNRTTYFRKTFNIENLSSYTGQLVFNLMKDDGAVVYLNGKELSRITMPSGPIEHNTFAYHTLSDGQESDYIQFVVNTDELREGQNIIAVEIHQRTEDSSDMSFDLNLLAAKLTASPIINMDQEINFSLSDDTIWVANFQATGDCLLPEIIDQATTLTIDCSPYYATGNVLVLPNISLQVEAGVEIIMPPNAGITIEGDLQILGTLDQPVVIHNNTNSNTDSWKNLRFKNTTAPSTLSHLQLSGASKGEHPVRENAAISTYFSKVNLNYVHIEDVKGNLIFSSHSDLVINNCMFHAQASENALQFEYGQAVIFNCTIKGNDDSKTTAIRCEGMDSTLIQLNKIYDFLGKNSNGIEIHESNVNINLIGNFIHNCTDKGILVSDGALVQIKDNTIVNCQEGVSIKNGGVATLKSNTFYNTDKAIRCYEKDLGSGGGFVTITNSILSNSSKAALEVDSLSYATISYSLSDTEELSGFNNLFLNPLFVNPTLHDFTLQSNSPSIGSGLDQGIPIDMGTKSHVYAAIPSLHISSIHYHPALNPEAEFIEIENPGNATIDLSGYRISQAIELTFEDGVTIEPNEKILIVKDAMLFTDASIQVIQWQNGQLDNGGETIRLIDNHGIIVDQVSYDDDLPWPLEADGLGAYLSLIGPELDNHFAESWWAYTTSIKDEKNATNQIFLNPNPTRNWFTLSIEENNITQVEVFNALGQKYFQQVYTTQSKSITLSSFLWPKGIYVVRVNGRWLKQLIVI